MSEVLEIIEEKNVIDDHLLDIIGNEFKFSHEKGLSEWLKNSVDAYNRNDISDEESFIIYRFSNSDEVTFECIDFVGMTLDDINKALKRWGDPNAAKRGTRKRTFGGHGNGGKFYMRQMFKQSCFITYRSGKLNVFGFNESRRYGFAKALKDKKVSPDFAMKFAEINDLYFPPNIKEIILRGKTGFTVAKGIHPSNIKKGRFNLGKICEKFKHYPQARQILKYKPISIIFNNDMFVHRLLPEKIIPMQEFENPIEVLIPPTIIWEEEGDKETVLFTNKEYAQGKLTLYTSNEPLSRNTRLGNLNRIDIIGEIGVIASYKIQELGHVRRLSAAEFICGECYCPILEDPDDDCVKNDRTTLVEESIKTKAFKKWVGEQIDKLASKIEEKEKKEIRAKNIETLSEINKVLNDWKNKFMSKIMQEILGGLGEGLGGGYGTGGSSGGAGSGKRGTGGGKRGGEGEKPGGGSSETKPREAFPKVLLSSIDADPLYSDCKVDLLDRQEPVYQRPEDVPAGIYWINTSRKLAQYIIDQYGVKSMKWRDYHFQRIIDVVCKEALYKLEKQDPENFNAARVDGDIINKLVGKAHDSAVETLGEYLLEDEYKTPREELLERVSSLKNLDSEEKKDLLKEIEEAFTYVKSDEG